MIDDLIVSVCAQSRPLPVSARFTLLTLAILGLISPDDGFVSREMLLRATGLCKRQLIRIIQKLESENLVFRDVRKTDDRTYYGWARLRAGYFGPAVDTPRLGADS